MIKFTTSQDSEYLFDENLQMSKRTKNSGGSNQGTTYSFLTVVFIKEIVRLYAPSISVNIQIFDKKNGTLKQLKEINKEIINSLNEEKILVVAEKNRTDGSILHMQRAYLLPEVDLYPFEIGYHEDKFIKHIGNKIVKIQNM